MMIEAKDIKTLDIYKQTPDGVCGDWHTVIWGSESECLQIALKDYPNYFWKFKEQS
jgi:hypothetical protein